MDQRKTSPAGDPDLDLVKRALAGEFAAFDELVNRHEKRVYALAMRIVRNTVDAQDVTQNTMMALLEKLESFRGQSSFSTWLLRIATNEALVFLRRKRVRATQSLSTDDSEPLPHPDFIARWKQDPAVLAGNAEVRGLIEEALNELDEKYRLVFVLRDVQGLSTEETAEALDISPANVKVRLLRARLMLREKLTRVLGDETTAIRHMHD